MAAPYIPARDAELDTFLLNFGTHIAADPAAYGLSTGDAAPITARYAAWHAAYEAASHPGTRTLVTVAEKRTQRALCVEVIRRYAAAIRTNSSVSTELKMGLGIRPVPHAHTRVPAPDSAPLLMITGMRLAQHTITAVDEHSSTRRAKPQGTIGLLLFRTTGDAPATDPRSAELVGFVTRASFTSAFETSDSGKVATYFGRWTNAKGQLGPWSAPASMRVAA